MNHDTKIMLDRLDAALSAQGVTLKRSRLLTVAAAAYGFRNANELSAAIAQDRLSPPVAEHVGRTDQGLVVARDPVADALFAFEGARPDARADRWCVSPYGTLLDASRLPSGDRGAGGEVAVRTASISHRHGVDLRLALTTDALASEIAGYCEENWDEARRYDPSLPEDPSTLDDHAIASAYFGAVPDEDVVEGEAALATTTAVVRTIGTTTGDAWVACLVDLEADDPILWWNERDGFGDLASATVAADDAGRLPDVGDRGSVSWVRLPTAATTRCAEQTAAAPWSRSIDEAGQPFVKAFTPFEAAPGIVFAGVEFEHRDGRRRVVLTGNAAVDETALDDWADTRRETLTAAGAVVEMRHGVPTVTFEDASWTTWATSPADWAAAMRHLLAPRSEPVMAWFRPEAWLNNNAVEVDSPGPNAFDVTFEILLMGREEAAATGTGEADPLREAILAPTWIREWSGPFTIHVAEAVHDAIERGDLFASIDGKSA